MKNFLRILLLPMMLCCWSCSGGGEEVPLPTPIPTPEEKPKIEVTTTAPILPQEGETATVTFTSSETWTIEIADGRAVAWCSVSPTSGGKGVNILTIKTTPNDTYDERNAKVTIKAGTVSQSFLVTQKQKDGLIVNSNNVEIGAEGGDFSIEVKANVKFECEVENSAKSWISSNNGRGLTTNTLIFQVKTNEKAESRKGYITIKGGENLTEIITIFQEGKIIEDSDINNEVNVGIGSWENGN